MMYFKVYTIIYSGKTVLKHQQNFQNNFDIHVITGNRPIDAVLYFSVRDLYTILKIVDLNVCHLHVNLFIVRTNWGRNCCH